jgi:hypothetical protein
LVLKRDGALLADLPEASIDAPEGRERLVAAASAAYREALV